MADRARIDEALKKVRALGPPLRDALAREFGHDWLDRVNELNRARQPGASAYRVASDGELRDRRTILAIVEHQWETVRDLFDSDVRECAHDLGSIANAFAHDDERPGDEARAHELADRLLTAHQGAPDPLDIDAARERRQRAQDEEQRRRDAQQAARDEAEAAVDRGRALLAMLTDALAQRGFPQPQPARFVENGRPLNETRAWVLCDALKQTLVLRPDGQLYPAHVGPEGIELDRRAEPAPLAPLQTYSSPAPGGRSGARLDEVVLDSAAWYVDSLGLPWPDDTQAALRARLEAGDLSPAPASVEGPPAITPSDVRRVVWTALPLVVGLLPPILGLLGRKDPTGLTVVYTLAIAIGYWLAAGRESLFGCVIVGLAGAGLAAAVAKSSPIGAYLALSSALAGAIGSYRVYRRPGALTSGEGAGPLLAAFLVAGPIGWIAYFVA